MKNPNHVFFILIVFLLFVSCRKESYELVEAPKETTLKANSVAATLIQRTSMNDGSNDNIIDNANCFNIKLPINVRANNQQINISTEADYNLIEAVFDEFSTDVNVLEITFPIIIIRNDFSEAIVRTKAALTDLSSTCLGENIVDEDIECLDFVYPIRASLFNKTTELTNTLTITDDKQLYSLVDDLAKELVITVDFPINVVLSDDTETVINDLDVLEAVIEEANNSCDEDDDFDYNDDDILTIEEQEFVDLLTACNLVIEEFELNEQHLEGNYVQYYFVFNADGSIDANLDGDATQGTWSVITNVNNKLQLSIILDSLTDLNGDWSLHEINPEDSGSSIELKHGEYEIAFRQNCG